MNQTRNRTRTPERASRGRETQEQPTIEQLENCDIEYMTVPAFIHRNTGMASFDDMTRFGDRVGRVADAMQLVFQTTMHRQLGPLRAFPLPLLERVYRIMSKQLGWPALIEAPQIEDRPQADERLAEHLRTLLDAAADGNVKASIGVVLDWIENDRTVAVTA